MMDHPNIARVLDAGTTDDGYPFFCHGTGGRRLHHRVLQMRTNYLPGERLGLFVSVCRAIGHAHQKGVIHRDIKPSNVLVALHDGVPVPKVIDFGVAKAIEEPTHRENHVHANGPGVGDHRVHESGTDGYERAGY